MKNSAAETKFVVALLCLGAAIAVLAGLGAFKPVRTQDVWTAIPADATFQPGPFDLVLHSAHISPDAPAGTEVEVHGQIHVNGTTSYEPRPGMFLGSAAGVEADHWYVGSVDTQTQTSLAPGLGWQPFTLVFVVPEGHPADEPFQVGVGTQMLRANNAVLGDTTKVWVPAPRGQRTSLPIS